MDQLSAHAKDFKETAFWEPFEALPDTFDAEVVERLRADAETKIKTCVQVEHSET